MTVIYVLKCPTSHQVKYVGEGGETRPFDHVRKVRKGQQTSNPRLTVWIKRLLDAGREPIVEILRTQLSKPEALLLEAELIKQYGRRGIDEHGILLNVAERGREYDRSGKNNPFFGRTHSPETLEKMAEAKLGKSRGEKFSQTMREVAARRGPQSEETRMKKRASMLARWELKRLSACESSQKLPKQKTRASDLE